MCCNTASSNKAKLSHSVHRLSKSTMNQYRSIHNSCFKGSSRTRNDQLEDIFEFERCSYPPAIRSQIGYVMRPATNLHLQMLSGRWCLKTLFGQVDKASMHWMTGPWWTEYRGSGVQPTMTYVDCTLTTSEEDMDIPLLCSTGTRKNYPRNMGLMNAAQVEEQAQQWISLGIWSWSLKKKTSYPTRTSSDSLGC